MANLKSSKKQARKNVKHRAINLARKTALKTAIKKVLDALAVNKVDEAQLLLRDAQARFARAQSKGLIHANNASRHVSRLAKKISGAAQRTNAA
jgi:small subunit ribosomal protein S20